MTVDTSSGRVHTIYVAIAIVLGLVVTAMAMFGPVGLLYLLELGAVVMCVGTLAVLTAAPNLPSLSEGSLLLSRLTRTVSRIAPAALFGVTAAYSAGVAWDVNAAGGDSATMTHVIMSDAEYPLSFVGLCAGVFLGIRLLIGLIRIGADGRARSSVKVARWLAKEHGSPTRRPLVRGLLVSAHPVCAALLMMTGPYVVFHSGSHLLHGRSSVGLAVPNEPGSSSSYAPAPSSTSMG